MRKGKKEESRTWGRKTRNGREKGIKGTKVEGKKAKEWKESFSSLAHKWEPRKNIRDILKKWADDWKSNQEGKKMEIED